VVLQPLTQRKEWKFFAVLPKAVPVIHAAEWLVEVGTHDELMVKSG
jgi:hypothetical protein